MSTHAGSVQKGDMAGSFGLDAGDTNNGLKAIWGMRLTTAAFFRERIGVWKHTNILDDCVAGHRLALQFLRPEISTKLIMDVPYVLLLESESLGVEPHGFQCLLAGCVRSRKMLADWQVQWCRLELVVLHARLGSLPGLIHMG